MTEADALRRAVVAYPDDDTPRLIFADWLEEHSQPDRAAFIRAQIEAARLEPWSPTARALEQRAAKCLEQSQDDWLPSWADARDLAYRRGFVERVAIESHDFSHSAERYFEQFPVRSLALLRRWTLDDSAFTTSLIPVFENPLLRHLVRLELARVQIAPEELYALSASPHLANLRELSLSDNPLSVDWLADFLAGDSFPNLTALDLGEMANLGRKVASGLSKGRHRRFAKVNFSGIRFLSDELILVLRHPALAHVEELRFGWKMDPKYPGPMTHIEMAQVMPWRKLRLLDLSGQGIGSDGVRAIARNADAGTLRWLGLAANAIGADGVDWLLESQHLHLYYLDVRGNGLSKSQIVELHSRFPEAVVVG